MSLPEFDISGQKVLVAGAGRGIGKGIALAFAEAGADVAITSLSPATVGQVAQEVRALGRTALPLTGDATKAADMERIAADTLREFGHVDTLVNCVGDAIRKPVAPLPARGGLGGDIAGQEGMSEEEWHFVVDVNLTVAFQGCRGAHRPTGHFLAHAGVVQSPVSRPSEVVPFPRTRGAIIGVPIEGSVRSSPRAWRRSGRPMACASTALPPDTSPTPNRCRQRHTRPGRSRRKSRCRWVAWAGSRNQAICASFSLPLRRRTLQGRLGPLTAGSA